MRQTAEQRQPRRKVYENRRSPATGSTYNRRVSAGNRTDRRSPAQPHSTGGSRGSVQPYNAGGSRGPAWSHRIGGGRGPQPYNAGGSRRTYQDGQEAAERKRRRDIKRLRRRRKRRRQFLILAAVLAALFVLPKAGRLFLEASASWIIRLAGTNQQTDQEHGSGGGWQGEETMTVDQVPVLAQGGADRALLNQLQNMYQSEPDAADILAHPENYPDALLLLLAKRPETLNFVKDYPEKKNEKANVDLQGEVTKGTVPQLYQWDSRWGYDRYGDTIVALAGCGPTCLSMVALGLTGDVSLDPGSVAAFSEKQGYLTEVGTSWDLMTLGAKELGLTGQELPLDENRMIQALQSGNPIICSMRPGDFTDTGHFIVLTDYEDGAFIVHDPNSIDNSRMNWTFERIKGQIKNLWAYSVGR